MQKNMKMFHTSDMLGMKSFPEGLGSEIVYPAGHVPAQNTVQPIPLACVRLAHIPRRGSRRAGHYLLKNLLRWIQILAK